jgi:RHS repeat-associated protein
VAARYLTSPGAYGTLYARVSADGTVSWYITDLLGSVRQIVDTSGNVLDAIVYDPWGNIVSESNPANGDRFKYAGGQYDALQQTYLFTARWENPQEGRWQSLDPIGFLAGDVNLYRYVFNSPATYNDPIGEGITGRITSIVAKLGTKIIATLVGGNLKKKVDLSRYEDERITFVITAEVRKTGNDDPRQYNVILASDSFYITPFAADWGRGNPVPRDFWDIEASNFSKLNIGACESGEYTPPLTTKVRLDAVDNIQYPHWIMAWLYYYYALRVCNCGNTRLAFGGPVFLDIKQDQWMPGKQKVKVWPPNFEGAI